jgi:hypothetical protein
MPCGAHPMILETCIVRLWSLSVSESLSLSAFTHFATADSDCDNDTDSERLIVRLFSIQRSYAG